MGDLIEARLIKSEFSSQKTFLPKEDFKELVTEESIEKELVRWRVDDPGRKLTRYFGKHARKTFAILACCGLVYRSSDIMMFEFRDSRLPIERGAGDEEEEDIRVTSGRFLPFDDPTLEWFRSWDNYDIKNFCTNQWSFLSIAFTDAHTMEDLHPDCTLTFLKFEARSAGGSISHLYKATIQPDHQCTSIKVSTVHRPRYLLLSKLTIQGTTLAIKELINREG